MAVADADILDDVVELLTAAGVAADVAHDAIAAARQRWGGGSVYIRRIARRSRDEQIQQGLQQGKTVEVMAKTVGCCRTTVSAVKRKRSKWL
jgi:pyrroline-5-carboxylate reductase